MLGSFTAPVMTIVESVFQRPVRREFSVADYDQPSRIGVETEAAGGLQVRLASL